jgi:hypothetical protein
MGELWYETDVNQITSVSAPTWVPPSILIEGPAHFLKGE